MSTRKVKTPFLWLLIFLLVALLTWVVLREETGQTEIEGDPPIRNRQPLAALGLPPDWSQLERFQETISRETFFNRLESIYTKEDSWKKWITLNDEKDEVSVDGFTLRFSEGDKPAPGAIFDWKTRGDLSPTRALPLEGLHIGLDPGHIGGSYAAIEDREIKLGGIIIREGTMTLRTAELLKPMLEEAGASVSLIRSKLEPVTKKRAKDFTTASLFYRTSEIRARAKLVNESIKPDLVICLHYNGSSSRTPETREHFHIILNGTYTERELTHEDERFQMLQRLLSGTITEEIPLAREIAGSCNDILKLPPYRYPWSPTSQNVANHPNLWARNLLANRLYQCPVIFMEPFVMNSIPFLKRYRKNPREIYRTYARAVAEGLTRYYSQQ